MGSQSYQKRSSCECYSTVSAGSTPAAGEAVLIVHKPHNTRHLKGENDMPIKVQKELPARKYIHNGRGPGHETGYQAFGDIDS